MVFIASVLRLFRGYELSMLMLIVFFAKLFPEVYFNFKIYGKIVFDGQQLLLGQVWPPTPCNWSRATTSVFLYYYSATCFLLTVATPLFVPK